ncbi:MAG: hypothetical protein HY906_15780, partial [Deltaproteobacteria bacterium]|nr:hypothetical protein [Deltaproteobacteria bacterium]
WGCREAPPSDKCFYQVCYQRADGTPALVDDVEAWSLIWSVPQEDTTQPLPFRAELESSMIGFVGVLFGPYPEPCIENWLVVPARGPRDAGIAAWTKIQGFAPVVTDPALTNCGARTTQVVEPMGDALDATQLCRALPADNTSNCVDLTVVGADGQPLPDGFWAGSSAPNLWPLRRGYESAAWAYTFPLWGQAGVWLRAAALPPGTIVAYGYGYLPYIGCLDCGAYTIQLEPLP